MVASTVPAKRTNFDSRADAQDRLQERREKKKREAQLWREKVERAYAFFNKHRSIGIQFLEATPNSGGPTWRLKWSGRLKEACQSNFELAVEAGGHLVCLPAATTSGVDIKLRNDTSEEFLFVRLHGVCMAYINNPTCFQAG